MSSRTTKARREAAIGRVLRGESTAEDEGRKLKVKARAVRAWVTMARNGTRAGARKKADESTGEVASDGVGRPDSSARLDRALRSAEVEDGDEEHEDGGPLPVSDVPPPDPEALVAFTETVRGQALKLYASVVGLSPDDPEVEAVLSFSEREKATLKLWAPYAAKYVPVLLGRSEEVGAWIFVGVNVASLWTGMAQLRRLAPKKTTRSPGDPFPASAASPRPGFNPNPTANDPTPIVPHG